MKETIHIAAVVLSLGELRDSCVLAGDQATIWATKTFRSLQHTQATRSHDKFFGSLSLACDGNDTDLMPATRPRWKKFLPRYASIFVRRGNGMDLLYRTAFQTIFAPVMGPQLNN